MSVIVVGAGPAGATTALLLARYGVDVTLFERETSFDRVFRGEGLMPSGIDALIQMGLDGVLKSVPSRPLESWNIYIDGREVFVIPEPIDELGDRAMRVVSQPAFLEKVVEAAGRYPSFRFARGARVRGLLRDGGHRIVGVQVETASGAHEARADLVIGCDGRGSVVRTQAGLHLEQLREQYDVLWFKLPAPASRRDRCAMLILWWRPTNTQPSATPRGTGACSTDLSWARAAPAWCASRTGSRRRCKRPPPGSPSTCAPTVGRLTAPSG